MTDVLDYLRRFNRKERFFLVGQALGNQNFRLSDQFCHDVGTELLIDVPPDAFVAMDYHLDWLYASLHLSADGGNYGPHLNDRKMVRAQQEDIDLLIAYQAGDQFHIVLVEAKGESAWSNQQMISKAGRFGDIFGAAGSAFESVVPHFLAMSPRRPHLRTDTWPTWMLRDGTIPWLRLDMGDGLLKISRWTPGPGDGAGKADRNGTHWKVIPA
ncbi:MAG: hypothetical protein AB7K36_31740 [Chloroflexota bacterium]